jgi:GAF domain-containing protein
VPAPIPSPTPAPRRHTTGPQPGPAPALPAPRPEAPPSSEPLAAVVLQLLVDVASTQELLNSVVTVAVTRVPHCDEASISLARDGHLLLVAASGDAVRRVTEAQYQQGLGPCPAAAANARATVVDDITVMPADEDWAGIAEGYGVRAMLAVPLCLPGGLSGTLAVHTRSGPGVPPETTVAAQALAGYAAQALTIAHRLETGT